MPTWPSHQSWSDIQSTTSLPSIEIRGMKSINQPVEAPVPRMSAQATA